MTTQLKQFRTPVSRIREKIAISFSGGKSSHTMKIWMSMDHVVTHARLGPTRMICMEDTTSLI